MKRKGDMTEQVSLLVGLLLVLLLVSAWQRIGTARAEENFGDLKIHTITQVKGIVGLMQEAPVVSESCIPISGCSKLAIHKNTVEIWGAENEYFKEPAFLSTDLSTSFLPLYEHNEKGELVEVGQEGFVTTCGGPGVVVSICFKKQNVDTSSGTITVLAIDRQTGISI
ncbi:MAG: hypothetical protein JW727_04295 [Candidatus Aenigmarchaeota archaeon]|nr:hypothetical protein [Candidatus Aenigmarchaeota archaeon]